MEQNNRNCIEEYISLKLEYELHNQNNDSKLLSELSFDYSNLLSLNFDEVELLYGEDFKNTDMYKNMLAERNQIFNKLEKRFEVSKVKNLDLLKYFGDQFYLFEMNKTKDYQEDEKVALISNSDFVDLDTKINDLEAIMNETNNQELKQDILDWIKYKKACLNNFGNLKDDSIVYISSSNGYISRKLDPVLKNTYTGDIAAKTLMEEVSDTTRRAGTLHLYQGKIVNAFLSLKLIDENVIDNSLNKYVLTLNLDVDKYTFIEAIENNPNNIVSNKRDVTKEDIDILRNDSNPYWLLFNVEVVKTECSGFTIPSLLKTYSLLGFKILNEFTMNGKQRNYVREYQEIDN